MNTAEAILINEKFTKRQKLTKTATLELKPIGNTLNNIKKQNLIAKDKAWDEKQRATRPYIDAYLTERIDDTMRAFSDTIISMKLDDARAHNSDADEAEWCKNTATLLGAEAEKCVKKTITENLTSAKWLFDTNKEASLPNWLLKKGFTNEANVVTAMKGTASLYQTFCTSRKTAVFTGVPKRVADNFVIYCKNMSLFRRLTEETSAFVTEHADALALYSTYSGFSNCVTTEGMLVYNRLINGEYDADGNMTHIGYNMFSNLENDKIKARNTGARVYRKAKALHKQILAPAQKAFTVSVIDSNDKLLEVLSQDIENTIKVCGELRNTLAKTDDLYVSGKENRTFSRLILGNHAVMLGAFEESGINEASLKKEDYLVSEISAVTNADVETMLINTVNTLCDTAESIGTSLLNSDIWTCINVKSNQAYINEIVSYANATRDIRLLLKCFNITTDKASALNDACDELAERMRVSYKATDKMRNYITRSINKETKTTRILFDTPTKLTASWWNGTNKFDKSQTAIIKMDDRYHLFMMSPHGKPITFKPGKENVDVLAYPKAQEAMRQLPKVTFSKAVKSFFEENAESSTYVYQTKMREPVVITREQYNIYKNGLFKTSAIKENGISEEELKKNLVKILSLYKKVAQNYTVWDEFDLDDLKDVSEYTTSADFFSDVDTRTAKMSWLKTDRKQIESLVENGDAFMFLITGRNMYDDARKKTLYAKVLLDILSDANMANIKTQLNGSPAIYYRPAILPATATHPKNTELVNKHNKNGERIPDAVYEQLYHYYNGRLTEAELSADALSWKDSTVHHKATFDITKNARYTRDMWMLTYSYTIGKDIENETHSSITSDINEIGAKNILAISRGATELLHYALSDKDGNLIEENSLDVINGTDYFKLLAELDRQRKSEKANNWIYDTSVASVKDGYIAAVTGILAKMAVKNNAIIVVEKINDAAREKWVCIDNQIFGKFIEALESKLMCYRDNGIEPKQPGGALNPLNLVPQKNKYNENAWQKGIVYELPCGLTRFLDESGFTNAFDFNNINSKKKQVEFFKKFERIEIVNGRLEFQFNYLDFNTTYSLPKTAWTVSIYGKRSLYDIEKKKNDVYEDIVDYFTATLKLHHVSLETGDILAILDRLNKSDANLLMQLFRTAMNGVVKDQGIEYRVSPITGEITGSVLGHACKMMTKKYLFTRNWNSEEAKRGDSSYAQKWLETVTVG